METAADSIPQPIRDAFATNDVSQFRTTFSELPDSGKAAVWNALGCDAAAEDKPDILALLLPHRPKGQFRQDIPPDGLLACVADSKSPRVCDVVIDAGIDITIPGSYEPDLLEYAIDSGDPTLARHILSPSVQARTKARLANAHSGLSSPAILAARSSEMAQLLIDHGMQLQGTEALHHAARDSNLPLMECLMNGGVDINENLKSDGEGGYYKEGAGAPLHWAVYAKNMDAAKLLLARGADKTAKDADGRTALERAKERFSKISESDGPLSTLYPHILTSCFLDVILVPLCSWLYLILVLTLLFTHRPTTSHSHGRAYKEDAALDGTVPYNPAPPRKRSKVQLALTILYTLLLIAQLLMCILEITRLALANLGIGLLPFTLVAILVAGSLHLASFISTSRRGRSPGVRGSRLGGRRGWTRFANIFLWVSLIIVNVVKIVEETKEGVDTRVGTKYPMSDEVIDVGVMVGVYAVFGILEMVC
ncbi:hypothetical protein MMC30_002077 [Trapelia coarctata]|nr:hypothetical protein [Trapelia coarctata]